MYTLNKSIGLHQVVIMLRNDKHTIKLQYIRTEQMHLLKYAKVRC